MRGGQRDRMGIGNRDRKASLAQQRQVRRVIAHAGALRGLEFQRGEQSGECLALVVDAQIYVTDAELAAAGLNRRGVASRNDCDLNARGARRPDAVAIAHVKCLAEFAVGAIGQSPVGQDAIDVQHQQANHGQRHGSRVRSTGICATRARRAHPLQTTPARMRS